MLTIYELKFEVCSPCQNDCELCAHADLMRHIKGYQLSLEDLDRFLQVTKESDYFIRSLAIHGPGEPFLWKHLNEGLIRIKKSGVVGWITMASNGFLLDRATEEAWACIDWIGVSVYPNFERHDMLRKYKEKYPDKVHFWDGTHFYEHREDPKQTAPIPTQCNCPGPMFYNNKIFPFCGPPVFGAARAMGVDLMDFPDMHTEIAPHYLDKFDPSRTGNLEFCKHCWANTNFKGRYRWNDTRREIKSPRSGFVGVSAEDPGAPEAPLVMVPVDSGRLK